LPPVPSDPAPYHASPSQAIAPSCPSGPGRRHFRRTDTCPPQPLGGLVRPWRIPVATHHFAVMYLRNGGDAFTLQKLLGHSDLAMTRRYCELAQADVVAKHRACSPGDRFLGVVRGAGGRRRLK